MSSTPDARFPVCTYRYHMICRECREQRHDRCRGGSWCDCQHRRVEPRDTQITGPSGD